MSDHFEQMFIMHESLGGHKKLKAASLFLCLSFTVWVFCFFFKFSLRSQADKNSTTQTAAPPQECVCSLFMCAYIHAISFVKSSQVFGELSRL